MARNDDGGGADATSEEPDESDISRFYHLAAASDDEPPKLPKERPSTKRDQFRVVKQIAKGVFKKTTLGKLVEAAAWLYEYVPYVQAYFDEPKGLDELRQSVSTPARGYDIHHIVEQTPAEQDGFSQELIESSDNLVRIPTLKHWEITGWAARKNDQFGGLSPREYLRGKDWEERMRVGRQGLVEHGVLEP